MSMRMMMTAGREWALRHARRMLATYENKNEPLKTKIVDSITDLLHLAHSEGEDEQDIVQVAMNHFAVEKEEWMQG